MATPSQAKAVKSLNNSGGRRRFVFKTFSQRIDDIDIDVYRSLNQVKSEPSEGSSFFRDCLTEWRELNTAEDFISFYEEMIPLVQTLPLVILHKETIMLKLLSILQIKARLSLEPVLRLIAALSRDLLEEFLPFLPNIAESLFSLLESGADTEPEIIEQIFTSWSYIMMYLQKYLINNLAHVLKVTRKLRYYPKDYVQDFMAEAVSFLFRNAPFDQLKIGIWKVILEVVKKPEIDTIKYGVSALLCHVMRGTSSRLHSKADREFGRSWVVPKDCQNLLRIGQGLHLNRRGRILWKVAILAGLWGIWLESNRRIFEGEIDCLEALWDRIRFWVATWLYDVKDFSSFSFSVMVREWSLVL
ncbi:Coatomer beta subunit [Trema orientale]|uniref:Coatomer beta subunit n=1 Tax=Trema orientale TaxID=63057 RepID=A0A2P5C8B2_TREOI|nr:Coatomer beta subunit [Trema orientale]